MLKHTRLFAGALAVAVVLGGCSSGGGTTQAESGGAAGGTEGGENLYTEVGTLPIVTQPITMKAFLSQASNIVDFSTNTYSKYMEEQTGITLTYETTPSDAVKEKINLKLSSGDYPDIFIGCGANIDEARYGVDEGILIDVSGLIETQMPELQSMMAKHDTMKGAMTATDGKIYMLPDYNDCYHCTLANKMWVNTDQLEKMGEKVPTTIDEFYELCKKFKAANPNNVPLASYLNGWNGDALTFLGNSYTYRGTDEKGLRLNGDKVDSAVVDDGYRELLKFMRKMYSEGLYYEASFTMDVDQMKSLLLEDGEPVLFFPAGASVNMIDSAAHNETYSHYYPIAPLKGPGGVQYASYFPTQPTLANCITTACKYPEAAARLIDFNYKFETKMHRDMGEEGTDWSKPAEGELGLTGEPALFKRLRAYSQEPQNVNWQDVPVGYAPSEYRFGEATDPNVDIFSVGGLEKMLYQSSKELYEPYITEKFGSLPTMKFLSQESNDMQTITVELEKSIDDFTVQFVTGKMDINDDSAWESYKTSLNNIGLDKLLSIYQTAYDRQYK